MSNRPILLDTCALIWLVEGNKRMTKVRKEIEKSSKSSELYVCPISIWEICIKAAKGKLRFSTPVFDWLTTVKSKTGIQNTVLSDDIMYQSTILPGDFHNDPADRMIVATAMVDSMRLVTGDKKILDWANRQKFKLMSI